MPSSAELLLDTSAAVALMLQDSDVHVAVLDATRDRRLGLAGHANFETLSVLTRLPGAKRTLLTEAASAIARNFPFPYHLSAEAGRRATDRLVSAGIAGGAVFDGLVAIAADEAGIPLLTCDRRALPTYAALGVTIELV